MSKYGDLIKKARETEPESQTVINTESQKTSEPDNQTTINPENQSSDLAEQEQMVNLCVKVPISQRRYWMSKAKEQGITVTSVIVEALIQKFGEPENQETRKPVS